MSDKVIIGLLALVAGAVGGFGAAKLADSGSTNTPASDTTSDGLEDRFAALEADIAALRQPAALTGSGERVGGTHSGAPVTVAQLDELKSELTADLKSKIDKQVDERMAEMGSAAETAGGVPARPERKRMSLADASRELGLSSAEEDEVRQVYATATEDALKLLAGEDGDIEEVRADLEKVRKDPAAGMQIMGKYLPRIFPAKIGEFMQIRTKQQQGLVTAVGKEKAGKLERDFVVEESDPFGMRGRSGRSGFRMRADFGGGR